MITVSTFENSMTAKRTAEHLKPFQWKKGVSGNPKGRGAGTKTLKEFAREYLLSMPEEDKLKFLAMLPPEIVFRMAEGNPHTTTDTTVEVTAPVPILGGVIHKVITDTNHNTQTLDDKSGEGNNGLE